jgi:hypothetical protein
MDPFNSARPSKLLAYDQAMAVFLGGSACVGLDVLGASFSRASPEYWIFNSKHSPAQAFRLLPARMPVHRLTSVAPVLLCAVIVSFSGLYCRLSQW